MKKRLIVLAMMLILTASASASLFASSDSTVLRMRGYISGKTTITANDRGVEVSSNQGNFDYSVVEQAGASLLFIVAN